jgi:pimeloyl-ACP methyl ester carboxylesterase
MKRAGVCALATFLAASGGLGAAEAIGIAYDRKAGTATVTIRARDGKVSWGDVLRGLARAKGFDDRALAGVLPDASFEVDSFTTRLILIGLTELLKPDIELEAASASGGPTLRITLDRKALLATERRLKKRLREAFAGRKSGGAFRLALDDGWQGAAAGRSLVIVVPGLQSSPERFRAFRAEVRKQGFPTGAVAYPNDGPVAETARMLSRALRDVAARQRSRPVALVATSMGGLVARAMIEDPRLDPGNVRRLIMVGTPNHGSRLAEFAFALEVAEFVSKAKQKALAARLYAAVEDGLGEAYDDLTPGSGFLKRLNARGRNAKVRYTLLLGSGGFLDDVSVAAMRVALWRARRKNRFVRFLGPRLDAALADLDEVKHGKGDGAVSIARGRLAGVEDTVVLPFNHLTMVHGAATPADKQLRREILRRLSPGAP